MRATPVLSIISINYRHLAAWIPSQVSTATVSNRNTQPKTEIWVVHQFQWCRLLVRHVSDHDIAIKVMIGPAISASDLSARSEEGRPTSVMMRIKPPPRTHVPYRL